MLTIKKIISLKSCTSQLDVPPLKCFDIIIFNRNMVESCHPTSIRHIKYFLICK